jgi:hypothetical protein
MYMADFAPGVSLSPALWEARDFAGQYALDIVTASFAGLSTLLGAVLAIASIPRSEMKAKLWEAVKPVFWGLVLCLVLFSLLRLFDSRESLALTFSLFALVLLGARLMRSFLSGVLSVIAFYALAALAFFFLIADLAASSIDNTVYYALPIILGVILFRSSRLLEASQYRQFCPAVAALGLLMVGGSMWVLFDKLSEERNAAFDGANILSGGLIALGLARLGAYGTKARIASVADVSDWMQKRLLFVFIGGALIGLYFAVVRPAMVDEISFAPLVEWALVCLVIWYIYRRARSKIEARSSYSFLPALQTYTTYTPEMNRVLDEDFAYLTQIQQEFAEEGQRDRLVVYLAALGNKMGVSQAKMSSLLHPLIDYQEIKSLWYPFNWDQASISQKNRQARLKILSNIVASLGEATREGTRPVRREKKWRIRI